MNRGVEAAMAVDAGKVGMTLGGASILVLAIGTVVIFSTREGAGEARYGVASSSPAMLDAVASGAAGSVEGPRERPDTGGAAAVLAGRADGPEVVPDAPDDDVPPTDPEPGPPVDLGDEVAAQAVLAMEQAIGDGPAGDTGIRSANKVPSPPKKKPGCQTPDVTRKDGVYHIPRGVLDRYATSPGKAGELGSFWWAKNKKGEKTGVRLGRLPCPGLLRSAGFRRGDLILSVNGAKPTSIARAVAIYGAARRQGTAEVVVRRGRKGRKKKVRLQYRFTD
ncbi:MAG: hypothetical protein VX265_05970 [Myxococcota bacterium]|nr:hypothetical protein [Myxococcota bacterium]